MIMIKNWINTLMARGTPAETTDKVVAELTARVAAQADRIGALETQRDLLKAQSSKAIKENAAYKTRVSSFISDRLIILLEKQNRLLEAVQADDNYDRYLETDVIIAHHFDSLLTALALKEASGDRIKVLFDCVEHPIHRLRTPGPLAGFFETHRAHDLAHQSMNDHFIRQCDHVTFTSPGHQQYLDDLGVSSSLVWNTKDTRSQSVSDRVLRQDLGAAETQPVVLFLNHAYPRGGLDEFMDIVDTMAEGFKFGFLGLVRGADWFDRFKAELPTYADRLTQLDLERPNRIVDYIKDADCVICSFDPTHEGYNGLVPIRFFDAVMAGVPIIAPKHSRAGQLIEEHGLGIAYWEGNHLAAVREACEMKKTRSFQANSKRARKVFGWENAQLPLADALDGLLAQTENARVLVIANKPLRNNSRLRNFTATAHERSARTDVIGLALPDEELNVEGVTYFT